MTTLNSNLNYQVHNDHLAMGYISVNNITADTAHITNLESITHLVFGELEVSGDVAVDGGAIVADQAATFELLSTSNGVTAATRPTIINIGSSTIGPLVTTNIQSHINIIGQALTGRFGSGNESLIAHNDNNLRIDANGLQLSGVNHWISRGAAPVAVFLGGAAAGSVNPGSTDLAGGIRVTGDIAAGDTCTVTFANAYSSAPKIVITHEQAAFAEDYDVTITAAGFVLTGTGNTGTGQLNFIVIQSI